MTEDVKSLRDKLNKKIAGHKTEYKAVLGNASGQVRSLEVGAGENDVYVTLYNGDVTTVYNGRLPLYPYRKIIIGYDNVNPSRLQVLRWDDVYRQAPPPAVLNHARQHEWDAVDALRVSKKQVLAGLLPRADGMNLLIYGGEYYCNDKFCVAQNMTIDMTTELAISSGAKWINVEIDDTGAITYQSSSTVASRALLTPDNIPVTASDKLLVCSIRAYTGQSEIVDTRLQSDIYDPRFIRGGGGFSGDPLRVVYTDSGGAAKTSDELAFNEADDTLTIGDPSGTGDGDGSYLHMFVGDKAHAGAISSYHAILTYAASAAKSSLLKLISSLGTKASPLAVALDTILGRIQFYGYDGDTPTSDSAASARIQSLAAEGFTSSAHGTKITFSTTPTGSTTMQDVAEFGASGQVKLNKYGAGTYTGTAAKNLSVTSGGDVIESTIPSTDGWIPVTENWTYFNAYCITVPSNATVKYPKGVRIKFKQGGGWKYYIGYPNSSTKLYVIVNTDYTVANAAITDIYISYISPADFPEWFAYAAVFGGTGVSIGNGAIDSWYTLLNKNTLFAKIKITGGSTTNWGSGYFNFGLPIESGYAPGAVTLESGTGNILDNSAGLRYSITSFTRLSDMRGLYGNAILQQGAPITFANGDIVNLSCIYQW